mgnify:CR=1 FL=1
MKKMSDESEKSNLLLTWNENVGKFDPIGEEADMDEGIFLELDEEKNRWRYFYIKGASLIQRRTALRAANGIARTGYVHPANGIRYGVNCELEEEVSAFEDMPRQLRKAQRFWYDPKYKKKKK